MLLVDIEGFKLSLEYLWIRECTPYFGNIAKSIIFLVPIFNTENRCWKLWCRAIERLDPMPEKVIFCENNSSDDTLKLINEWKFPHEVIRIWFKSNATDENTYIPIAHVRQLLLTRARQLNPEYAIFLDDDMIPEQRNWIEQLINNKLDLVGGAYTRIFDDGKQYIASKWDIDQSFLEMPYGTYPKIREKIKKAIIQARKNNNGYLSFNDLEKAMLYKVAITSGGALALSRKLIQDKRMNFIPIRHDLAKLHKEMSEDFGFCLLAESLGYPVYLDGKVRFAHMLNNFNKNRPWIINKSFSY